MHLSGVIGIFVPKITEPMHMRKREPYAAPQTKVTDYSPERMFCASFNTGTLPGFDFEEEND